jgi:predicted XRE-type DNA-binding protein
MNEAKRKALEAAGHEFTTVADFLGLTPEEERLVELRVALAGAIRRRREAARLTQEEAARRIRTNQPRFAKIEAGAAGVSLDQMFRGLFAVGGGLADLTGGRKIGRAGAKPRASRAKANA